MPNGSTPNLMNLLFGKQSSGIAGGGMMKPYNQLKAEELASWQGYDPNNQKSRATQYANAYNAQSGPMPGVPGGIGPPAPESGGLMRAQMQNKPAIQSAQTPAAQTPANKPQGPPAPPGPSIWDKLSGGAQKIGKGLDEWGERYMQRGIDRGRRVDKSALDEPWSVKSIEDDKWLNRKGGILFDPNDPDLNQKMIDMATDEDGNFDRARYDQIKAHQDGLEDSPVYQQKRDKHYEDITPGPDGWGKQLDEWWGKIWGTDDENIDFSK